MIEFHVEPAEALRQILATVVELTKLRQDECKHLAIENFAPELLRNMLRAYYADAGATITTDCHIEPVMPIRPETPAMATQRDVLAVPQPSDLDYVDPPITEQELRRGIRRGYSRTSGTAK
jgi:hypothetical protein